MKTHNHSTGKSTQGVSQGRESCVRIQTKQIACYLLEGKEAQEKNEKNSKHRGVPI